MVLAQAMVLAMLLARVTVLAHVMMLTVGPREFYLPINNNKKKKKRKSTIYIVFYFCNVFPF